MTKRTGTYVQIPTFFLVQTCKISFDSKLFGTKNFNSN